MKVPPPRNLHSIAALASAVSGAVMTAIAAMPNLAIAQSHLPRCPSITHVLWSNCQGTLTQPDGGKYVGEFKDGKANGQGTYTYADGNMLYVGEFKDGKQNGQGTLTRPDGAKHVGEFKDNQFNGQGTLTYPDSSAKYVGEFKDDKRNGQGTLYPVAGANGSIVAGTWNEDSFVSSRTLDRRVALVIGNSAYGSVQHLSNPSRDADLIGAALRSTGIEDVTILHDRDRESMVAALRAFARKATPPIGPSSIMPGTACRSAERTI